MQYIKVYNGTHKSEWFKYFKTFYNFCKTRSYKERLMKCLCSDYGSELQTKKVKGWLIKEGIIFEPLALYSEKQNDISEKM